MINSQNLQQSNLNPSNLSMSSGAREHNSLLSKLIEKQILTQAQQSEIKTKAMQSGRSIEDVLTSGNYVTNKQLFALKSELFNIPFANLTDINISLDALNKISQNVARKNMAIAYEETPDVIKIAMADPLDIQKVKFIRTIVGKKVEPHFADPEMISSIIDSRYGTQIGVDEVSDALEDVGDVVEIGNTLTETSDLGQDIATAPVSRIVNLILEFATKHKASDVHIEQRESRIAVRYRVGGVLEEKLTLPKKLGGAVVSRIKILSNLKIDEHRMPQDGRFQIKSQGEFIDLRVSIMPAVYGEKVVMRLLPKGGAGLDLEETGMTGRNLTIYKEALKKTQGIILVTGPTGSGKTVTLASSLKILNRPEVNIMTLEDPVEIRIDGITQVQVNSEVGLTFAKGLRSFLRQDPDIIMVGEIRDRETAELAVQASLTGHLVLATLHTSNAAGGIPRLTDMDIEAFLLSSTINVIAAQRLTRRICKYCRETYTASPEEVVSVRKALSSLNGFNLEQFIAKNGGKITLARGRGCPKCSDAGYKGRIGIFEMMKMSDTLSAMTVSRESAKVLQEQAIKEGMITMIQDGFLKVLEGMTTIEEVLRVIS